MSRRSRVIYLCHAVAGTLFGLGALLGIGLLVRGASSQGPSNSGTGDVVALTIVLTLLAALSLRDARRWRRVE